MFPFTKILETPVVLHKKMKDDDILFFSYSSYVNMYMYILDRNDVNTYYRENTINTYSQHFDISKIKSTVIRENYYFGNEIISYKYLSNKSSSNCESSMSINNNENDGNINDSADFYLYKNENIAIVKTINELFIHKHYLKYKILIVLEKRDDIYYICYYYNNKYIDQFFNARRKDHILIHLLEKAEKQRIINKSIKLLDNILIHPIPYNDNRILYHIDSNVIFTNIQLYNYQKNDIVWFKNLEKNIKEGNNTINFTVNYYYPILNDNYIISSTNRTIIPNINRLMYNTRDNEYNDYNDYNDDINEQSQDCTVSTIYEDPGLPRPERSEDPVLYMPEQSREKADEFTLNNNDITRSFINKQCLKYYGGNIISDLGLGKTLIVLYAILSEFFDERSNPINRNLYNFIEFGNCCNYFYKLGQKKGLCCNKEIHLNGLFCNEHKKSIFIDKRKIIIRNREYFDIKNYIIKVNTFDLLNTKSTLIICPSHLCNQWITEYYTKCNDKIKKNTHVLLITTYNQYANLTISDILFSDIVVISYTFLVNNKYTNRIKNFNKSYYHLDFINTKEFPLDIFNWHRIIFEEFHELRNTVNFNNIKRYIKSLKSNYRWNISGTPFANGINGYLDSLELNTNIKMCDIRNTNDINVHDNNQLNTVFDMNELMDIHNIGLNSSCDLIKNTKCLFKRNTKESIKNEYISNIILEHVNLLTFTDEERSIYDSHLIGFNNKYSKFLIQLCCHPELYSETRHLLKNCKTLTEIRNVLLMNNKKNMKYYKQSIDLLTNQITELESRESSDENSLKLSVYRRNLTNDKKMYVNLEKTYIYLEKTINSIKENDIESCPICLDDMDEIAITSCGHKFCWKCIEDYSKMNAIKKCPCCKTIFTSKDVYLIKKSNDVSNTNENEELRQIINNTKSTKIGNIIYWLKQKLLKTNSKSTDEETEKEKIPKIIVFSQWDEILNKVSDCLSEYNINVVHCKGSVYQKKKSIELFMNSDKFNIIMLSSRNAASGINLTVANEIVLIEPVYGKNEYRKNIENQAIGRCARIGNTQNINVNRFIINNTIESDIYNGMIDDSKLKIMPQNT